ncbi:LamG-like jellyroll fold domain-containing protein [Saccharomonospora azurea]|uniref:LamG-like jellyroll fold domain-containing protein n=1 Tax=Saccharomonospora azurea TaxID=40988 RepID=UPI00031F0835|nr:LamG-like jellyroll fold domain-containing protein [Saccharomonospora azurea]
MGEASEAARAQGEPVEVAELTTETTQVVANPEGTFTLKESVVPERARRDGRWVDTDYGLVVGEDGAVRPRAAAVDVAFSGGSDRILATIERDGARLALEWSEALPVPAIEGDTATYEEIHPGVDLRVRATPRGFGHEFVVKTPEAAGSPALERIDLALRTENVDVNSDSVGNIQAVDDDGNTVFHAPAPSMWDSAGTPEGTGAATTSSERKEAPVKATVDDGVLSLEPDQSLLTDPAVTYPLVIDPTFSSVTSRQSAWTLVRRSHPTTSHWNLAPRDDDERYKGVARIGHAPEWSSAYLDRSFFRFSTSMLDGAQIEEAHFRIYQVWKNSNTCDEAVVKPMYLYLTGDISTTTTWDRQPAWLRNIAEAKSAAKAGQSCGPTWVGMDAESAVQQAADEGWNSVTFGLKAGNKEENSNDPDGWKRFHVKKENGVNFYPQLTVEFNRAPNAPSSVTTDPTLTEPCRWCDGKRYFGSDRITLQAKLSDPDGGQLTAKWNIKAEPTGETMSRQQTLASGSTFGTPLDLTNRHGQTISWSVHGSDGALSGPSRSGPTFVVDRQAPAQAPTVSSVLYREDNAWHGGVDVPGEFTFQADGVEDVDHYVYGFSDPPTTKVDADSLGGDATVVITPPRDGPVDLYVQSVDRAGLRSPMTTYHFYVRAGTGPASHWPLDGNAEDGAFLGERDGSVHGDPVWGPGAVGAAALLDGVDDDISAANAVRTDASFSVATWVRLDGDPVVPGGSTALSQDGEHRSGFLLQAWEDGRWQFALPGTDALDDEGDGGFANSDTRVRQGEWTHLVGVYDAIEGQVLLYVNGQLSGSDSYGDHWNAGGEFRIGRAYWDGGPLGNWKGAIDEVGVYDRALTAGEAQTLASRGDVQVGHWKFDQAFGTTVVNEVEGGGGAILSGGASLVSDGAVNGAVTLDGVDDYVATDGPAVRTDHGFSVAAWVRLDRLAPEGGAFTAVSQDDAENSGFLLQHRETGWSFSILHPDQSGELAGRAYSAPGTAQAGVWTHLVGVFDAKNNEVSLYVDGVLADTGAVTATWDATGSFVMGRARWQGQDVDYWDGSLDEVRVYSRVVSAAEIEGVIGRDDVVESDWRLDGNARDESGAGHHGSLGEYPSWIPGRSSEHNPGDLAVELDGSTEYASAPVAVSTSHSFSVSTWVKVDELPSQWSTIVSQNGEQSARFDLAYGGDGRFAIAMYDSDTANAEGVTVYSQQAAQAGVWTHLAAVYNAVDGRVLLYVNGTLNGTGDATGAWDAMNDVSIGRSLHGGTWANFLAGAVDDVKLYSRPLREDEIRLHADRDLTLVHEMRLDENGGTTTADSMGGRTGTLHNGAQFGAGRTGNAIHLDGVDDHVSTAEADLRFDRSFTVSAWVRLDEKSGTTTAVSLDGAHTSKFRLGHVRDSQNRLGSWVFEMAETDSEEATVTKAALSRLETEVNTWVHLVGVYEANSGKLWLYVNGTRLGDGTLQNAWDADGGLQIGRGKSAGTPAEFWPGAVDDVRLYTGGLTADRIETLFRSYPDAKNPSVPQFPEGSAVRAPDSEDPDEVFLVVGGARITLLDEEEYLGTGRTWEQIMRVPYSALMLLPDTMRDGTLVTTPNSDQVWVIEDGQRMPSNESENVQIVPARTLEEYPIATA